MNDHVLHAVVCRAVWKHAYEYSTDAIRRITVLNTLRTAAAPVPKSENALVGPWKLWTTQKLTVQPPDPREEHQ